MGRGLLNYQNAVETFSKFLHGLNDSIDASGWEDDYKRIKGLHDWFGDHAKSWDDLIKQSGEKWIGERRKDTNFREYFKLRKEIDRLKEVAE